MFGTCFTQIDFDFRKSWDKLVVKLDVIDKDPVSGTEIVQWITHFPVSAS